jgi:hypothetical protein
MKTYRKSATLVGILFLVATSAGVFSFPFLKSLNNLDYLIKVGENQNPVITGAILIIIMAFACAGIGIGLYPVLKNYNEYLALGAVGFRLIEAVFHAITLLGILPLLALSRAYIAAGTPDILHFHVSGTLLESVRDTGSNMGLLAWCTAALMYYTVFYQSKLIPRWLSGWGLIAIFFAFAAVILDLYGIINSLSTIHTILNIPIAIQEIVFAVWLIAKGFNTLDITGSPVEPI